jgi:hypothetical protein
VLSLITRKSVRQEQAESLPRSGLFLARRADCPKAPFSPDAPEKSTGIDKSTRLTYLIAVCGGPKIATLA